jgi:hypothetical protein
MEVLGDEVILSGGIGLHNVSSLALHVQVEDSSSAKYSLRSRLDVEDMRSILEGSSVLAGIESELVRSTILLDDRIVLHRGSITVGSPVDEASIGSVTVRSEIVGGDVVSESKHAVAVVVLNARQVVLSGRESQVVHVLESHFLASTAAEVVVSAPGCLHTVRSGDIMSGSLHPLIALSLAISFVVLRSRLSFGSLAVVSGLHILGLRLIVLAPGLVVSKDD